MLHIWKSSLLVHELHFLFMIMSICFHGSCIKSSKRLSMASSGTSQSFFDKIGRPKYISAPMVDQSELAWRLLVRKNGADLAFSQMLHAKNFVNDWRYRGHCIDWDDYTHKGGLNEKEVEAKKLDQYQIAQIAGDDPEMVVAAGKLLQNDVVAIDLNLGCPQKIAKRGNYGAYLLPDTKLIVSLLTAMVNNLEVPITAKLRCLSTDYDTLKLMEAVEKCGVSMITLHGRTAESSKLYTGPVNWDIIKKVKSAVSVPLVANGGISCKADVERCLELTGCDAVMSSEGLLENPKLFSDEGDELFRNNYVKAQLATATEYLEIVESFPYPRPFEAIVRGHMFKMLYKMVDAPRNKDLQSTLSVASYEEMKEVLAELKIRMSKVDFDTERADKQGLLGPTTWYMRHRDERAMNRVISVPKSLARMREEWKISGAISNFTTSAANYNQPTTEELAKEPVAMAQSERAESLKERQELELQSKLESLKSRLKEKRAKTGVGK